jgi:Calcineurin-like phosphoesterase
VTTAIVSDLHLGTVSGLDVARRPEARSRLLDVAAGAERLVLLGDLLELRERPATAVLTDVAPLLRDLGEATAGKQVLIVPGNHDHQLVAPALERARLADDRPLPLGARYPPQPGELGDRVAALMPRSDVVFAYPGAWLRDDVYALHGHYLDVHLTVPRVECLIVAAVERFATGLGDAGPTTPEQYEAILAPIYALSNALAQNARARPATRRGHLSRNVWSAANDGDRRAGARVKSFAIGRAAIPAAVKAINAAGMGPFNADISGEELRRAGLRAIGEVVERLGIEAEHVIFGHTHRAGPLDGETDGWRLPSGTCLTNTGSWVHEDAFVGRGGPSSPYWPGRVTLLGGAGPPELTTVLRELEPAPA